MRRVKVVARRPGFGWVSTLAQYRPPSVLAGVIRLTCTTRSYRGALRVEQQHTARIRRVLLPARAKPRMPKQDRQALSRQPSVRFRPFIHAAQGTLNGATTWRDVATEPPVRREVNSSGGAVSLPNSDREPSLPGKSARAPTV